MKLLQISSTKKTGLVLEDAGNGRKVIRRRKLRWVNGKPRPVAFSYEGHGMYGYKRRGCRCETCKASNSAYTKELRRRKAASQ